MLLQLLTQQPQALGSILKNTPIWVWGLLAGLLSIGVMQLKDRQVSLKRTLLMPVAWVIFGLYGVVSAFGNSGSLPWLIAAWLAALLLVATAFMRWPKPPGTLYQAATQSFAVRGSVVPLLLILGIFMTKYIVGIELALAPRQAQDATFALPVAMLYGAFSGIFVARAASLYQLSRLKGQT